MAVKQKLVVERQKTVEYARDRGFAELQALSLKKEELEVKALTEGEIAVLVDGLLKQDAERRELEKKVEAGKKVLLRYAETMGKHIVEGNVGVGTVTDSVSFTLLPTQAIEVLKTEKKLNLVNSILKVAVTEFRKYLGSDLFERSAAKEEKSYAAISLKKK